MKWFIKQFLYGQIYLWLKPRLGQIFLTLLIIFLIFYAHDEYLNYLEYKKKIHLHPWCILTLLYIALNLKGERSEMLSTLRNIRFCQTNSFWLQSTWEKRKRHFHHRIITYEKMFQQFERCLSYRRIQKFLVRFWERHKRRSSWSLFRNS